MDCDESLPEDETISDVPMILSHQLRDIFHIFTSMLDIKSFMKFAMANKETYKRCMEDKAIKISVNEKDVAVSTSANGSVNLDFKSSIVNGNTESYRVALRRLPCVVNLRLVQITAGKKSDIRVICAGRQYLEELKVNRIEEFILCADSIEQEELLIPFVKDFKVKYLCIGETTIPILRSVLQLNVTELSYDGRFPPYLLLEANRQIPNFFLEKMEHISMEKFMQLLGKIQSGSLGELRLNSDAVDFSLFNEVPFDHEGELPEGNPLFIRRRDHRLEADYCWFLHRQGGVTACTIYPQNRCFALCKCDPSGYPWILRKEEEILKDLAEKHPRVFCSASQFQTFLTSLKMLDSSHEGRLPSERPLYCRVSEEHFWLLEENDRLMECIWDYGCATWEPFNKDRYQRSFGLPSLAKYVFWKLIREYADPFNLNCENREVFDGWFEDFKFKLDFNYSGPLPDERPLVFERIVTEKKTTYVFIVILLEEHILECKFGNRNVDVNKCEAHNRPSILMTAEIVKEILQANMPRSKRPRDMKSVFVELKTFLDGFELFKESPIRSNSPERQLYTGERKKTNRDGEITEEERWYGIKGKVKKVTWKKGRFHFSGCSLRELPFEFVKKCFKPLVQMEYPNDFYTDYLSIGLEQFRSCLEQFTVVPYNYSGPLTSDSPLAFVKDDIRHTCGGGTQNCCCSGHFIHVCFLWKNMRTTYCSWGEFAERFVILRAEAASERDAPLALRSKEYLEAILKSKFSHSMKCDWFGQFRDVLVRLKEYKTLPYDYDGPLPEERPLVFNDERRRRFILRADGTYFECLRHSNRVLFRTRIFFPAFGGSKNSAAVAAPPRPRARKRLAPASDTHTESHHAPFV